MAQHCKAWICASISFGSKIVEIDPMGFIAFRFSDIEKSIPKAQLKRRGPQARELPSPSPPAAMLAGTTRSICQVRRLARWPPANCPPADSTACDSLSANSAASTPVCTFTEIEVVEELHLKVPAMVEQR